MPPTDSGFQAGRAHGDAPDALEHPRDAAAWFSRMHSGEATDQDRQAFAAWCSADPANERAYRRLACLWDVALAVPEQRLRALMHEDAGPSAQPRLARRRAGLGLALACTLAAAAGLAGAWRGLGQAADGAELATRKGQRHLARLPDGSSVHLNGDTRLVVRFGREQRRIELQRGEAFFDVRRDPARPFVVDGGKGRVTVTGTRFNVRRDAQALQVSVASGSVRLASGRWWQPAQRRLAEGEQAVALADGTLGEVVRVDVGHLTAWQDGKVVFRDMPLAAVIQEMNRYLAQPARLAAPELGRHRVSGVFSIDDPEAMIAALPAIAPVRVYRLADGRVSVVAP